MSAQLKVGSTIFTFDPKACPKCEHFACICDVRAKHEESCKYRKAVTCPVGIECEHGFDVCPICDPCTCEKKGAA